MQAKSVIFDVFGDYVRETGGSVSARGLTAVLECFDIPPDSARVVLSRLTREGWFTSTRNGRGTAYEPTDAGWRLLDVGLERIMEGPTYPDWDHQWRMVIFTVPERDRAARRRIRTKLAWSGFAQLAASTWVSPRDRLADAEQVLAAEPSARFDLFCATGCGPTADSERAAWCWSLDELATDYREFSERCTEVLTQIPHLEGRDAMRTRTELVHEYRKFPFRDPDLPRSLLPTDWPAQQTHQVFLAAFTALRERAALWYRQLIET